MSRVNTGVGGVWYDSGVGKIWCSRPPAHGIESRLLKLTIQMVEENGFSIVLSSIDTGQHAAQSRHRTGRAEDVTDIHKYGGAPWPVTVTNPHALAAVGWLTSHAFRAGHENGAYDAVLLGPTGGRYNRTRVDHSDHLHLSIWKA